MFLNIYVYTYVHILYTSLFVLQMNWLEFVSTAKGGNFLTDMCFC